MEQEADQAETLLDNITDLVQSVRMDGSFAYVNRAWRETFGYSAAQIDTLKVFDIIHASSIDKCRDVFNRLAAGETVPPFETTFVTADGKPVQLEGNAAVSLQGGRPVMIRAVLRDVSARNLIERRLRKSEERFRKLVEASSDAIFLADAQGGITYASPSLNRVLGFSSDELLGTSGFALLHPDDLAAAHEYFCRVLAQPLEHLDFHCRVRHKDGSWRDLDVVCTNHLNDATVEAIVVNFRDVTERRRFDEERRQIEEQLRQTQKLESLGVLAGGIAHDFNNLLTVIIGNGEMARTYLAPDSPGLPLIDSLETAGRRAAELTRQMLAYAGRAPIERETFDISSLVLEMSQLLASVVSKRTPLTLEFGPEPALVDGDPTQIRQVVMNLITNASEAYGDRAGGIHVHTGVMNVTAESLQSRFITLTPPPGRYVCLEVRDAGSGMTDEVLARIFEPFFTTNFIGRGLGLSATLGIVRSHGGTIQVTSSEGAGTTARVWFPLATGRAPVKVAPPAQDVWRGTGRLLVVDDEHVVREVAYWMLTRAGFEVVTVDDGAAAVAWLREDTREVRAVLLDLTMPTPGLEVLGTIQRERPSLPVVLTSGYTEQDVRSRFPDQPWADFVQKPFAAAELLRVLRRVLEPAS
jgi:two-component system cell cycle sensor histidine kinase/response regulator CckA